MRNRLGYVGWALPDDERARLLELFPAAYSRVVAYHVTLAHGVPADHPLPAASAGTVVGVADDGAGVQVLVLTIDDGTGKRTVRPDGSTYHVTWSLGPGRKPVESNAVIRTCGWAAVGPVPLRLEPRFFPF